MQTMESLGVILLNLAMAARNAGAAWNPRDEGLANSQTRVYFTRLMRGFVGGGGGDFC